MNQSMFETCQIMAHRPNQVCFSSLASLKYYFLRSEIGDSNLFLSACICTLQHVWIYMILDKSKLFISERSE
jgi:hypothetical protein